MNEIVDRWMDRHTVPYDNIFCCLFVVLFCFFAFFYCFFFSKWAYKQRESLKKIKMV